LLPLDCCSGRLGKQIKNKEINKEDWRNYRDNDSFFFFFR
jgi:hypothetical protein